MAAKKNFRNAPFYSKGLLRKTSIEIIREAKQELLEKHLHRELTPFSLIVTPIGSRPSSSSSQLSFVEEAAGRPTSGVRLKPLCPPTRLIKSNDLPFEPVDTKNTSLNPNITKRNILPPISSLIQEPFPVLDDISKMSKLQSSTSSTPLLPITDAKNNYSPSFPPTEKSPTNISKNISKSKKISPDRKVPSQSIKDTQRKFLSDFIDSQLAESSKGSSEVNSEDLFEDEMSSLPSTFTKNMCLTPMDISISEPFTKASNISNLKSSEALNNELPLQLKFSGKNTPPSTSSTKRNHPAKICKNIDESNNLELTSTKKSLLRRKETTNVNFSPLQLPIQTNLEKPHEITTKISNKVVRKNLGSKCDLESHSKTNKQEGKKIYEDDPETKEFNHKVLKILPVLESMVKNEKRFEENQATEAIESLFILFENSSMFERNFEARFHLLKVLFKLLNARYPILSLEIIKLILQMKVSGKNLENISKLLLKICLTNEENITDILNSRVLSLFSESMQGIDVQNDLQTIEYFSILAHAASCVDELASTLVKSNFQHLLMCHLAGLNSLELSVINKKHAYIAGKIISSLQNLSSGDLVWNFVLNCEILEELLKALSIYQEYSEVSSLTIGFLTEIAHKQDGCQALILCKDICFTFIELLKFQNLLPSIVIKILLIIGNLVTADKGLASMFHIASGFKDLLFSILKLCSEKQLERARRISSFCRNPMYSSVDDVISETDINLMTNAIRILGNMCLDPSTGYFLSNDVECITSFMQVLRLYKIEHTGFVATLEEPLSCAHAGLKNVTYYMTDESQTLPLCGEVINLLISFLTEPCSMAIRVEICTTMQNMMRIGEARLHILQNELLPLFMNLLNERENEIVIGGYGIFMNLLVEEKARKAFNLNKGLSTLRHKLNMFLYRDWKVSTLLCKVLWNYCYYESTTGQTLPSFEIQRILKVLQASSDASVFRNARDNAEQCTWEQEFVPTVKNLITLLEIFTLSGQ